MNSFLVRKGLLMKNSSIQVHCKGAAAKVLGHSANSKIGITDIITQRGAPWGLARVSHRQRLDYGSFSKYIFDSTTGDGTKVYVLDSGIYSDHVDFEGRASWGTNIIDDTEASDLSGHGTHIAGTIAGRMYGVAKKSNVIAVKVLEDKLNATTSSFVKGLNWAVADHQQKAVATTAGGASTTANASVIYLGFDVAGISEAAVDELKVAIDAAISTGIQVVVPAGDDSQDTGICKTPLAQSGAIIVGASSLGDSRADFSNYGSCITLFAPGMNTLSLSSSSPSALMTLSGTAMAAAHVAGLSAYLISLQSGGMAPADLKSKLMIIASQGILNNVPDGTANLLAFNGNEGV
ncbi:hypothetical protein P7C71_g2817, partial [Lecanoromycetidae sp. Uapishka_2]